MKQQLIVLLVGAVVLASAAPQHVVLIGIDGLNPSCIHNATSSTAFKKLSQVGSWTLTNARTTIQTFSAPGWSSTLCAMRPAYTGVTSNSWAPSWPKPGRAAGLRFDPGSHFITPVTGRDKQFPCVFQVIKKQAPAFNTSSFYDWDWLATLGNEWMNGSFVDDEWFCDKGYEACDKLITERFISERAGLKDQAMFSFVYLGNVDEAGHTYGWCSDKYEEEVGRVNGYVEQMLEAIDLTNTVVMLTADHGGVVGAFQHSWGGDDSIHIPLFVAGPGVKAGYELKWAARNEDLMPTALHLLNLTKIPHWWTGRVIDEILI